MTVLTTDTNGHIKITPAGLSLLLGVDAARIEQQLFNTDHDALLDEWLRSGRRRQSEASAHTGRADLFTALEYWAQRDLGRSIVVFGAEAAL